MQETKTWCVTKPNDDKNEIAFYRLSLYGKLIEYLTTIDVTKILFLKEESIVNLQNDETNIYLKAVVEIQEEQPKEERIDA